MANIINGPSTASKTGGDGSSNDTTVYEDRYLAFFDILGFSRLIEETTRDERIALKISTLLKNLSESMFRNNSERHSSSIFSDCICVSTRHDGNVESFLAGLGLVVLSLLGLGYPVRGAVSRGKLFHSGNIIFGPCMIRAYQLESRLSIYPRIIIDPKLKIELKDDFSKTCELLKIDNDGLQYVNFLSPILACTTLELISGTPVSADWFASDISAKIDRLYETAPDDVARQKLHWLRSYASAVLGSNLPSRQAIEELVRKVREATAQAREGNPGQ